jgi:hypothetical protein
MELHSVRKDTWFRTELVSSTVPEATRRRRSYSPAAGGSL